MQINTPSAAFWGPKRVLCLCYTVLTSLAEEDEEDQYIRPRTARSLKIIDLRGIIPKQVTYSQLSHEEKENVLSDLLVKSAINHALDKQRVSWQPFICLHTCILIIDPTLLGRTFVY